MSEIYPWHEQEFLLVKNLIAEQRLPRVILLYGPKGVGKAVFAHAIAGAIGSGNIATINGNDEDSLKVDDIRELITQNSTKEFNGLSRVNILSDIEKLTEAAANALLKILEDCLSAHFIFTVTDISRVKPTLLSRCFKLNLSLQNQAQYSKSQQWLELEGVNDPASHQLLMSLANDGPLQAQALAKENYVDLIGDLEHILQEMNSINIISCKAKILANLKSYDASDSNKSKSSSKCHSTIFINMLYYLLNTQAANKYTSAKISSMNQLMISLKKDLDRGLALDGENLVFRLLYKLAGNNE